MILSFIKNTEKPAYINGLGCISPQQTFECNNLPNEYKFSINNNLLRCIEPVYKKHIEPMTARRMSRIVKMGVFASKICLNDANVEMPEAIITGTGFGCLEDTEKFITAMIKNDEKMLNPTPFIQSTHNTISAQIALFLKCNSYNITYSHKGISYENALIDSLMLINEQYAKNILVGGIDEFTTSSFEITKRMGHWKDKNNNLNILKSTTKGSIAGEGASFFLLSNIQNATSYSKIISLEILVVPLDSDSLNKKISAFLEKNNFNFSDIDLVLLGINGDCRYDYLYHSLMNNIFNDTPCAYFKHLCGEYHTATSFAMWLCSVMLKNKIVPEEVKINSAISTQLKTILIYNHYKNTSHSFILMQAC